MLAERSMCGDLRVADAQVRISRVIPEAVRARAALDLRHSLAAQPFVS
jgi:hypothetical protein